MIYADQKTAMMVSLGSYREFLESVGWLRSEVIEIIWKAEWHCHSFGRSVVYLNTWLRKPLSPSTLFLGTAASAVVALVVQYLGPLLHPDYGTHCMMGKMNERKGIVFLDI